MGIEQEQDIARLKAMGRLRFKNSEGMSANQAEVDARYCDALANLIFTELCDQADQGGDWISYEKEGDLSSICIDGHFDIARVADRALQWLRAVDSSTGP